MVFVLVFLGLYVTAQIHCLVSDHQQAVISLPSSKLHNSIVILDRNKAISTLLFIHVKSSALLCIKFPCILHDTYDYNDTEIYVYMYTYMYMYMCIYVGQYICMCAGNIPPSN